MVRPSSLLLTLGYGKRSIAEAIGLLEGHGVRFLVDVRSVPWSRHHPDFSQNALKGHLAARGIAYVFMGEELGGRPRDPDCYDEKGRVDYEACRRRPAFRQGIRRLRTAWELGQRVALLCSESRPQDCHRSKLLGVALAEEGIVVMHLDEDGTPVSQQEVMDRLLGGQLSLFDDLPVGKTAKSRRRYLMGEE
ncbi:MAG: DUF488 domain-containing protein [Chloroflexi bacterium]|nr:DUF488 domain-containing protein [Chloroflexota bacterium]